jgi:hypothetical protein
VYISEVEQKEVHKADATLKNGLKCFGKAGGSNTLVETILVRVEADFCPAAELDVG